MLLQVKQVLFLIIHLSIFFYSLQYLH
jgi:hypothetical protein